MCKHIHQLPDWQDAVYEADQGSVWIGDVQYSSCAASMCTSDIHPQKYSEHPAVVGCFSNEQKDSAAFWMWIRSER